MRLATFVSPNMGFASDRPRAKYARRDAPSGRPALFDPLRVGKGLYAPAYWRAERKTGAKVSLGRPFSFFFPRKKLCDP